jgi:tRNA-dihydrouridine synthase
VEPISVQIAGSDPQQMAEAARINVEQGAQIIDINMGCPAKKVCNVAAGSALLRDEALVGRILDAVVKAVDVPVTLKTRTGWSPEHRNALRIAGWPKTAALRRWRCMAAPAKTCIGGCRVRHHPRGQGQHWYSADCQR